MSRKGILLYVNVMTFGYCLAAANGVFPGNFCLPPLLPMDVQTARVGLKKRRTGAKLVASKTAVFMKSRAQPLRAARMHVVAAA
eukprot:1993166-Pyramimonas_sp.AAC.2